MVVGPGANLAFADLTGIQLSGRHLAGADLTGADLSRADLAGADLAAAKLIQANLSGADLTGASLIHADLTDAKLISTKLTDADLTGAKLNRADLTGAELTAVRWDGADLTDALLTKVAAADQGPENAVSKRGVSAASTLEIFTDKANRFRWRLKSGSGEILATSEAYATQQAARDSAEMLGTLSSGDVLSRPSAARFEIVQDKGGKFRWRLKSGKGEIIAQSQSYETRDSARQAVAVLYERAAHTILGL
ncbi:pentapeptide repeat-containing protein [Nocardia sp. NPDC051052]|uniref:pentapeptide repeat-containing protein n=1 Tax=Nocardia sp. NPDC051052 TaxID=3364322 RepID=UPI00378C35BA